MNELAWLVLLLWFLAICYAIWLIFFPWIVICKMNDVINLLKKIRDVTESIRFEKKEK